jgi:hypothetical protein
MSNIVFEPWIGEKYWASNSFGLRVLVLGESHYDRDQVPCSTYTTEVVERNVKHGRAAFFTKISKVLLNLDEQMPSDEERSAIWDEIAFYNYIQEFVSEGTRVRPSHEMWGHGDKAFFEILEHLKPQVLLVLGIELGWHLPAIPASIAVCNIQHPSTGFSYKKWNPLFAEALANARNTHS